MSEYLESVHKLRAVIASFVSLRPDWDSMGGRTIAPIAMDAAILACDWLLEHRIIAPEAIPLSIGGVAFHWRTDDIQIEFEPDASIIFVSEGDFFRYSAWHEFLDLVPFEFELLRVPTDR